MKDKTRYRLVGYGLGYDNPDRVPVNREKLGPMVDAYIECALWSTHAGPFEDVEFLDGKFDAGDIDEPTLLQMVRDNIAFYWRNRTTLERLYAEGNYTQAQCGHDFWLSRNGHGAGFFDRGWEDHWDELQQSAKGFGEVDLWVNDEDKVAQNTFSICRTSN